MPPFAGARSLNDIRLFLSYITVCTDTEAGFVYKKDHSLYVASGLTNNECGNSTGSQGQRMVMLCAESQSSSLQAWRPAAASSVSTYLCTHPPIEKKKGLKQKTEQENCTTAH